MEIEYNDLKFEDLEVGEVFVIPTSNSPMMKTEQRDFDNINAVALNSGHFQYFDDYDEVILKRSKLIIDN